MRRPPERNTMTHLSRSLRNCVPSWFNPLVLAFGFVSTLALTALADSADDTTSETKTTATAKTTPTAPHLALKLRKVRNAKGKVGCALFNSPAGFPMKPEKAMRRLWCSIHHNKATCSVQNALPPGTYAAVCIHDENGNGKLDTNWIGYPKEGVVASNHAKGRFGPPSFKDASFSVGREPKTVRMRIGY